MIKNTANIIVIIILVVFSIFIWEKVKSFSFFETNKIETNHNIILKEISSLGKLELTKYSYRDVVEHQMIIDILPDPKAILIVQGDAIGCIDLSLIKANDIVTEQDTIIIILPDPEICNHKIDHANSKIYNTEYAFMNEAELLDKAFKKAEIQILESAKKSDILLQTKKNAELLLKPLIENLSNKKVVIKYNLQANLNLLK